MASDGGGECIGHWADVYGNAMYEGWVLGNTHSKEGVDFDELSSTECMSPATESYLDDDGEMRSILCNTNYTTKEDRTYPSGALFGNGT